MVLAMTRPRKHPRTGVYEFRKRVPDRLRPLVGKREVKRSLKTKDPASPASGMQPSPPRSKRNGTS